MCDSVCGKFNSRFTITRGVDNHFVFTIKADGTTLPMTIQPSDTFKAHLMVHTDGQPNIINTTALVVTDYGGGKVTLAYPAAVTSSFPTEKGGVEDRFYIKPLYYLLLECDTAVNGYFTARVDKVYVD